MIIISGPTGVGKSDVALELAQHLPIEIINGDVGQFYSPLMIGTAKPPWQESPVPHHLFDVINEPVNLTVVDYLDRVRTCVKEIQARNHIPVIVGGTGFYLFSLFFPPVSAGLFQEPSVGGGAIFKQNYTSFSAQELWDQLNKIDSERAACIALQDRYRLMRALDIWYSNTQKPSTLKPTFAPICEQKTLFFVVMREREDLHTRINARVEQMFMAGWLAEVKKLSPAWQTFLLEKKLIGYDDIVRFIQHTHEEFGDVSIDELMAIIAQKTRAYAKRQLTFNRMITKKVEEHNDSVYTEWVNVSGLRYDVVAQHMCKTIKEKGLYCVRQ